MAITLEFGKKILMKRMLRMLEEEDYRVEYADDYGGYIVADKREDPNIFLLTQEAIDDFRAKSPGKPASFLDAVLAEVKNNVNAAAMSMPPQPDDMAEGAVEQEVLAEEVPPSPDPVDEIAPEEVHDLQPMPEEEMPLDTSAMEDAEALEDMVPVADEGDDIEEISSIIPGDDEPKEDE
jgi:hypothetical protein